jgi:hypothetical protein
MRLFFIPGFGEDESIFDRIHARADAVVKIPDEPFHEVPGDHFSLYTYPEEVYRPIVEFLGRRGGER